MSESGIVLIQVDDERSGLQDKFKLQLICPLNATVASESARAASD